MTSADGKTWGEPQPLARVAQGHYQVSWRDGQRVGTAFNYHPQPGGLNARTNLYYLETGDFGQTWRTADGRPVATPLTEVKNPALVRDYQAEKLLVYLKDVQFDAEGRPVVLYLTSKGYAAGPAADPRTWHTARWTGKEWDVRPFTTSDHNYDFGSLYVEADGTWRVIAPTEPGPQRYGAGGEMVLWTSRDQGKTWAKERQLTRDSPRNHTYARRPLHAHPDFYALWADGDARKPSESYLYFTNRAGDQVWRLPPVMRAEFARPEAVAAHAGESLKMSQEQASSFARLALKGIRKEYPNKPGDVLNSADDVKGPRAVHPAFYGCFDWHSSVHGHWMLVRLLRLFPDLPEGKQIRAALAENLTAKNLQAEADYFTRPNSQSFERPYGWAWLLKLAEELHGWDDPDAREWSKNLRPLAEVLVARYLAYFPKQTYPIRSGVHPNTAFGLAFALDYARAVGHKELGSLIEERSRAYFGKDVNVPAAWEPSGADFFSPSLMEADLMRRVLPPDEFRTWFRGFLPDVAKGEPRALFVPARVTDRSDPQIVHLDGLNLSRAWCLRGIAAALPKDDPARKALAESAARHAEAALPHVASGDYAGEHWLASFAVYLLSTPSPE
jgi:hypothetical protein